MLCTAAARGFQPALLGFESWYASLRNLKLVRDRRGSWLTQLKANRLVDPAHTGNQPLRAILIPRYGLIVHLKGYGLIKVFKSAALNGSIEYWATSELSRTVECCADDEPRRLWRIEEYHRGLKQFYGIERAEHRSATAQRNHLGLALRAFLRLECHRLQTGISSFEAKTTLVREAVRASLAQPLTE
jgi:putative transposase